MCVGERRLDRGMRERKQEWEKVRVGEETEKLYETTKMLLYRTVIKMWKVVIWEMKDHASELQFRIRCSSSECECLNLTSSLCIA